MEIGVDISGQIPYNGLHRMRNARDMKTAMIKIWFEGDVGNASIEFTKTYSGDDFIAHGRFVKSARKKFPNWERINVSIYPEYNVEHV